MKKLMALLMVSMLCLTALAEAPVAEETNYETVVMAREEVRDVTYEVPVGELEALTAEGSLTYVSTGEAEIPAFSLTIVEVEGLAAPEEADALIQEAVGGYMPDEAEISEVSTLEAKEGVEILTVEATLEAEVHRFYLIKTGERVFCLTACIVRDAYDQYVQVADQIATSFQEVAGQA